MKTIIEQIKGYQLKKEHPKFYLVCPNKRGYVHLAIVDFHHREKNSKIYIYIYTHK